MQPFDDPADNPADPLGDPEEVAQVAALPAAPAHDAWRCWKGSPTPQRLADTLHALGPVLDRAVSRVPRLHPAIAGGEARRLAIGAIRSFDPAHGASLTTHVHTHLRPLARNLANVGKGVALSRLERSRAAAYLGAQRDLREEHGREPDDATLCDHLRVNAGELEKMRRASRGEVAESQADHLGEAEEGGEDSSRLSMWTDFVYHDATPQERQILDLSTGRNGHDVHDGAAIATRLGVSPQHVNRKRQELARRILDGVESMDRHEQEAAQTN